MNFLQWLVSGIVAELHLGEGKGGHLPLLGIYRSLVKKGPWAVHITLCSDKGVGGYL